MDAFKNDALLEVFIDKYPYLLIAQSKYDI